MHRSEIDRRRVCRQYVEILQGGIGAGGERLFIPVPVPECHVVFRDDKWFPRLPGADEAAEIVQQSFARTLLTQR